MQQYKTSEAGRRLAKVDFNCRHPRTAHRPARRACRPKSKILRDAYAKAIADPEFLAEAAKRAWDVEPHTGAELEALAKDVIEPT